MAGRVPVWAQPTGAPPAPPSPATLSPNLAPANAQLQAAAAQRVATANQAVPVAAGGRVPTWGTGAAAAATQAQHQLAQPEGLLGQIQNVVERTPAGLVHFAGQAAKELFYSGPREIVRGIQNPGGDGGVGFRQAVAQHPIVQETGQSFARTAGDIAHPGRFVQAYQQGNLVGKALEDLANASVVASLASSPLRTAASGAAAEATAARAAADQAVAVGARGAALEPFAQRAALAESAAQRLAPVGRVGEAIHSIGTLGAQGANLPIKPIEWAGQALRSGAERLGAIEAPAFLGADAGATLGQVARESPLGQAVTRLGDFAKERAYALDTISQQRSIIQRQGVHDVEAVSYAAAKGLSPTENRASTLVADGGLADPAARAAIREAEATIGPRAIEDLTNEINRPIKEMGLHPKVEAASTYTPEDVKLALDYHDGVLPPEAAARIERGVEGQQLINKTLTPLQEKGRLTPLDPQQLGTELLAAKTTEHPAVLARQEALAATEGPIQAARAKAEEAAAAASDRQLQGEARQATAVGRIEQAGQAQVRLEGLRQQAADLAGRLGERAVAERLRGDQAAAQATEQAAARATRVEEASAARLARQPKPEPALTAAQEYAASQERVGTAAAQRLGVAAEGAAANQYLRSTLPPPPTAQELAGGARPPAPISTPRTAALQAGEREVAQRFAQGLRQEEVAARLRGRAGGAVDEATTRLENIIAETQRHEGQVNRAEAIRQAGEVKAQLIADNANDRAALTEQRAAATEGRLGQLQEKTPLRDVAQVEVGRTTRAAEAAGVKGEQYRVAQKELDKALTARNRVQRALDAEVQRRWASLDAAPARYRYSIATARAADTAGRELVNELRLQGADVAAERLTALLDEAPTTLEGLVKAGVDPVYLPGGRDPYAMGARRFQGLTASPGEFSLRLQKLPSELERQTLLRPTTIEGRAALAIREIDRATRNATAKQVIAERGKTAADLGIELTPEMLAKGGEALRRAAQELGWEDFDPHTLFGSAATVDAHTVFVPRELKRQVASYFKPEGNYEMIMKTAFDPIRRTWKHMVLPVSGRWHVGNILSNMVMNTLGTGSLGWVGELPQAWRAARAEGHGVTGVPARLFGLTAEQELRNFIRRATGKKPSLVMRALDKSYALNTFVDDLSRSSVFLSEQRRNLAAGMTAQQAEDQALRTALKVSGDFTRLTEFERGVVRRIVPFYTWARHVTQLVTHLAVENPIRLVWTLNLANLYAPEGTGPFGDMIPVGGKLVSVGNYSPLGTFENLYLNPRGPGAGVLQSIGPEFDIAAAGILGQNLGRGGQPLRLPPGEGKLDEFGNPINTALGLRSGKILGLNVPGGALANYAVRQVPLVNTARQFIEGRKLAEYDTGEPMLKGGKLINSTPTVIGTDVGGRLGILASQAGVPVGTNFDVKQLAATAAKRERSAEKASKRYRAQLAKAR